MARKKRALLMTVGTGVGDEKNKYSLAHGLMCSIDSKNPDLICFFGSNASEFTINALKKLFNEKFNEDFDECFENEFIRNDKIDKFNDYFRDFKLKISELEDDYKILIDYTSGTKTMTMAAAFASMVFQKELFVVTGERKDGVVVQGTEECKSQNLYQIYDELMTNKVKELFNDNRFESGKIFLNEITDQNKDKEVFSKLLDTYYYFDSVNHEKAFEIFDIKEFKKTWPDLSKQFELNIKALNIMNKLNPDPNNPNEFREHNLKKYYLLASILNNARRRKCENKFDDAIARLYRSLELIAQIRLSKTYNIDSSNVDINILKEHNLDEEYLSKLDTSGEIKFALTADYELLAMLNDSLGDFYLKNKKEILNILKFRNNSILAHGFESCSKKEYDEFSKIVLEAANLLHKDMEKFIDETKFPILS